MDIKNAKAKIEKAIEKADDNSKALLSLALNALGTSGAEYSDVSDEMQALLENESVISSVSEKWAEDVYIAALAMKRHLECKKYLEQNKKVIDGETASMWIGVISAILGILATVAVGLLLFFDILDNIDIDTLAYIIALAGWIVTIVVTIAVRIINKHRLKKQAKNSEYTVAELMAAKYADNPGTLGFLKVINGSNNIYQYKSKIVKGKIEWHTYGS